MAIYFLDSSAMVKPYQAEVGTAEVDRVLSEPNSRHFIALLAVVKVQSAFVGKAREGHISLADLDAVRQQFLDDITQRRFQVVRMTDFHYRAAARLMRQYGPQPGQPRLRTLDALHLAVALEVRQQTQLDSFVSADDDLCRAAEGENLVVSNPTRP
jgi:predicted nucleic acid-binding protein